jgi:chemotaxis methyl-accepting protein methylase
MADTVRASVGTFIDGSTRYLPRTFLFTSQALASEVVNARGSLQPTAATGHEFISAAEGIFPAPGAPEIRKEANALVHRFINTFSEDELLVARDQLLNFPYRSLLVPTLAAALLQQRSHEMSAYYLRLLEQRGDHWSKGIDEFQSRWRKLIREGIDFMGWGNEELEDYLQLELADSPIVHSHYAGDYGAFFEGLMQIGSPARAAAIQALAQIYVSATELFRYPWQLRALEENLPTHLRERQTQGASQVSVLSLGASSGEEATSLATVIHSVREQMISHGEQPLPVEVLGIDIKPNMVAMARKNVAEREFKENDFDFTVEFVGKHGTETLPGVLRRPFDSVKDKSLGSIASAVVNGLLPSIRENIHFKAASLVDPSSIEAIVQSDFIFLNEVLYQMPLSASRKVADALRTLREGSFVFTTASLHTLEDEMGMDMSREFEVIQSGVYPDYGGRTILRRRQAAEPGKHRDQPFPYYRGDRTRPYSSYDVFVTGPQREEIKFRLVPFAALNLIVNGLTLHAVIAGQVSPLMSWVIPLAFALSLLTSFQWGFRHKEILKELTPGGYARWEPATIVQKFKISINGVLFSTPYLLTLITEFFFTQKLQHAGVLDGTLVILFCVCSWAGIAAAYGLTYFIHSRRNLKILTELEKKNRFPYFLPESNPTSTPPAAAPDNTDLQNSGPRPYGLASESPWGELLLECLSGGSRLAALALDPGIQLLIELYPSLKDLIDSRKVEELKNMLLFKVGPELETKPLFIQPVIDRLHDIRSAYFLPEENKAKHIEEILWTIAQDAAANHRLAFFPGETKLVHLDTLRLDVLAVEMLRWTKDIQKVLLAYVSDPAPDINKVIHDLENLKGGLSYEHSVYNRLVHEGTNGHAGRPYATVPNNPSRPSATTPTNEPEPIRSDDQGFTGERDSYLQNVSRGSLPLNLQNLSHAFPWPADMTDPRMHITTLYGGKNYSSPGGNEDRHLAIDIQMPSDTDIRAVEGGQVIYLEMPRNPERVGHLVDVFIYSSESHLLWIYVHMDLASLPAKIRKQTYWKSDSDVRVNPGEVIGRVGRWHSPLKEGIAVPPAVAEIYGKKYDHLHLEVHYEPDQEFSLSLDSAMKDYLNPLLLMKKLYKTPALVSIKESHPPAAAPEKHPDQKMEGMGRNSARMLLGPALVLMGSSQAGMSPSVANLYMEIGSILTGLTLIAMFRPQFAYAWNQLNRLSQTLSLTDIKVRLKNVLLRNWEVTHRIGDIEDQGRGSRGSRFSDNAAENEDLKAQTPVAVKKHQPSDRVRQAA